MRLDTSLLEAVVQNPDAHFCGLRHDQTFVSADEIAWYKQRRIELEPDDRGFLHPFCDQVPGRTVSIGCPHSPELRAELTALLHHIQLQRVEVERCTQLLGKIRDINVQLNEKTGLDADMNNARDDRNTVEIRRIAKEHHECVRRLIEITREALSICEEHEL